MISTGYQDNVLLDKVFNNLIQVKSYPSMISLESTLESTNKINK